MLQDNFYYCSSGDNFTLMIDYYDNVWSFGDNSNYQLGYTEKCFFPKQIPSLFNIKSVDCGSSHSICLDFDGNVFTFGNNKSGELGIGNCENSATFQKVELPPIFQISCGKNFSLCLSDENKVYGFGSNGNGQLGIGSNTNNKKSPILIDTITDINAIICGGYRSFFMNSSGEFYTCGYGAQGQLGTGNNKSCNKPKLCKNWPNNIISIKVATHFTLLLNDEGNIFTCGWNISGQIGQGDQTIKTINIPRIIKHIPIMKKIGIGDEHGLCIDIHDNLWVFGQNYNGKLGLGDTENKYKPIKNINVKDVIELSHKGSTTLIQTSTNEIYGMGKNDKSQLGLKPYSNQKLPIQLFKDKQDMWKIKSLNSRAKSARK